MLRRKSFPRLGQHPESIPTMKRTLALIATLTLLSSCETPPVDPVAVESAQVYFPPRFRYVAEPRYGFSPAERERALREATKLGVNTLFEFVIDSEGVVKKARLVRTDLWRNRHEAMENHARVMVFSKDPDKEMYRAFYFPMNYTYESEFEWVEY